MEARNFFSLIHKTCGQLCGRSKTPVRHTAETIGGPYFGQKVIRAFCQIQTMSYDGNLVWHCRYRRTVCGLRRNRARVVNNSKCLITVDLRLELERDGRLSEGLAAETSPSGH